MAAADVGSSTGASSSLVRIVYRGMAGVFLGTAAMLSIPLPSVLLGHDQPLPLFSPMNTETAYIAASGGAIALGLAAISFAVSRKPEASAITAAPLSITFAGLALGRYFTYFFAQPGAIRPEWKLSAMIGEVAVFSIVSAVAALVRTDASHPPIASISRIKRILGKLKPHLGIWLGGLGTSVMMGPTFFLGHRTAQMLLAAQCLNFGVGSLLYSYFGLSRITGVAHLVAWTPAMWTAVRELHSNVLQSTPESAALSGPYKLWLASAVFFGVGSLCLDAIDMIRWFAGDRAEMAKLPDERHTK